MAKSVIEAFLQFQTNKVNLDPTRTKVARASRDWLVGQIHGFDNIVDFPTLYPAVDVDFGSFSRRTKIRPLDDIDLLIALNAQGTVRYTEYADRIELTVNGPCKGLLNLCHVGTTTLNSTRVINRFISELQGISQYKSAAISKNLEAVVLDLSSYEWSFDIVPCFFTQVDAIGRQYYVIPDGKGHWKKTDPRIDQQRVTTINQAHEGHVLNAIRALKYWNRRKTMPSIPSYVLECMALDYYSTALSCSRYVDLELIKLFAYVRDNIFRPVMDPKGIQADINSLDSTERLKIYERADMDHQRAQQSRRSETEEDQKAAILGWGAILGSEFPSYG